MVIYPYVLYKFTGAGTHILVAMAASLLVLWLHRENLRRLRSGTENKISLSSKKKKKESEESK